LTEERPDLQGLPFESVLKAASGLLRGSVGKPDPAARALNLTRVAFGSRRPRDQRQQFFGLAPTVWRNIRHRGRGSRQPIYMTGERKQAFGRAKQDGRRGLALITRAEAHRIRPG
jgi:hypothetical protein